MAQPELDFFKRRAFLLKAQPTAGTDALPAPGTDGFRLFEGSSSTEFDKIERTLDKPFFGGDAFSVANKRAKIEGEFELYAPATPGAASTSDADCAKMLLPAGMAVVKDNVGKTTRYNPISSGIPMVTAYWYHVRRLLKVLDARASLSGVAIEIGQRFRGKASLLGDYVDWGTVAMPTVTLPSKVPVVASKRNTECVVNSLVRGATASTVGAPLTDLHVWAKSLSVDFGSDLKHAEYTEKSANRITDRKPTFSLKLATTDITGDFDPLFVRDNGILLTIALSLFEADAVAGVHSGLYSKLAVRCQVENVTETDIDGDDGWELTGPCIPSDTGGDEFYIEFGDKT